MLPSAAELAYFIELCNALNMSRASERLGISQPSLSLAIKRLEESLGASLFVRHKQGVTLTQAGKQLFLHARQLLQYWEKTRAEALASQSEVQGYFTLGCSSTVAHYLVSDCLSDLLDQHPKLELRLQHDLSRKITEGVINLSIDIGVVVNPFKHPDLIIRPLFEDEVCFWVGKGQRSIQDYRSKQAIILCDPELTQSQSLLKKMKQAGINAERLLTSNSLEVVASLTAKGCGIGIIPTRVANAMYPGQLTKIANAPIFSDEICLVYRNENRQVQAIQAIAAKIKSHSPGDGPSF